jgi:hypothetical protein
MTIRVLPASSILVSPASVILVSVSSSVDSLPKCTKSNPSLVNVPEALRDVAAFLIRTKVAVPVPLSVLLISKLLRPRNVAVPVPDTFSP